MKTNQALSNNFPHRRKNILTGEWVLVSPQRTDRPWQGEISESPKEERRAYDPECYLCPGNKRAGGQVNPPYKDTFVFTNDFPALVEKKSREATDTTGLLTRRKETGICRVVNFSPLHDLTLSQMSEADIVHVIKTWREEFKSLGSLPQINYVQIFENKGLLMGTSNPHPHGQIWAQESIPTEPAKELKQFRRYYTSRKRGLLADYLRLELSKKERIVFENRSFVVLVPFWAVWPYETMIIPKRRITTLMDFERRDFYDFADAMKVLTVKYDKLFRTSFPYSSGIHQAPTDGRIHKEWHFHMHFYPPLLRSANIRKFMVGYELLAEPQRDLTPEYSAKGLRDLSNLH